VVPINQPFERIMEVLRLLGFGMADPGKRNGLAFCWHSISLTRYGEFRILSGDDCASHLMGSTYSGLQRQRCKMSRAAMELFICVNGQYCYILSNADELQPRYG